MQNLFKQQTEGKKKKEIDNETDSDNLPQQTEALTVNHQDPPSYSFLLRQGHPIPMSHRPCLVHCS